MSAHDFEQLQAENVEKFLKDGPRLRTDYNLWIEARDRTRGLVLLAGLGALGVGRMWCAETDFHTRLPGYEDAPEDSWDETEEA